MRGLFIFLSFALCLCDSSTEDVVTRDKRDYGNPGAYAKWSALSTRRAAILETLEKVDNEFHAAMDEAFVLANRARRAIKRETKLSNMRAWTYGITTIGASIFAIKAAVETSAGGLPLTHGEELGVYGQLAFGYGYGGPYLLEGQLGDPDPGCGGRDLFQGLNMFVDGQYFDSRYGGLETADGSVTPRALIATEHLPSRVRLDMIEHFRGGRRSVQCLTSNALGRDVERRLVAMEALAHQRLDLTEKLMANLERESDVAKELGYGSGDDDHSSIYDNIINRREDDGVNSSLNQFNKVLERLSTPDTALYYSPH